MGNKTMFNFTPEERAYFDRLCLAIKDAQANPDHWSQRNWHCKTSHCIAGFGDMRQEGLKPTDLYPGGNDSPFADEYPYWGFKAEIFSSGNSMTTILACLEYIEIKGFEYDRSGHNVFGYDRDGYNQRGWDRDGYNRRGFDRHGYNRQGFDRHGQQRPE
jgi:hypothetical protein